MTTPLDPDATIEALGLQPHPEGGWFAETWRDPSTDGTPTGSTAIYFLLQAGERSHWHRIPSAEVWHHYAGGPLEVLIAESGEGPVTAQRLGPGITAGERPQVVVPPGAWQAARPCGTAVLVGCTVSPPFSFDAFDLAPDGWEPGAGDPS